MRHKRITDTTYRFCEFPNKRATGWHLNISMAKSKPTTIIWMAMSIWGATSINFFVTVATRVDESWQLLQMSLKSWCYGRVLAVRWSHHKYGWIWTVAIIVDESWQSGWRSYEFLVSPYQALVMTHQCKPCIATQSYRLHHIEMAAWVGAVHSDMSTHTHTLVHFLKGGGGLKLSLSLMSQQENYLMRAPYFNL